MKTQTVNYHNINTWDVNETIYIDKGGYTFSFLESKHLLKVETGFNGYSHTVSFFHFTEEMNTQFIEQLEKLFVILKDSDAQRMKGFCSTVAPIETAETSIIFAQEVLTIKNKYSMIQLGAIWNIEIVEEMISLFKKIFSIQKTDKPIFHKKSDALLASMGMRYRHDYYLLDNSEKVLINLKMENIYDLYHTGMSINDISKTVGMSEISIKQVIEEIKGKGFYQP